MNRRIRIFAALLAAIYLLSIAGPFIAPYDPSYQFREHPFSRPQKPPADRLQLFVEGTPYTVAGFIHLRYHLFAFGGAPVFLLGTDGLGRDQLTRLLYGARISLLTGFIATALTLVLALFAGGAAGFYGGWVGSSIIRASEVFQTVPWLYMLIAVRAALPLRIDPEKAFGILIVTVGIVGWAKPARLVRGVALEASQRDYVLAALGFGATRGYVVRRHVLPATYPVLITQAALLVPQYILAEVTLSFLGLGVADPVPTHFEPS